MKSFIKILILAVASFYMTGCTSPKPIEQQYGTLDLNYNVQKKEAKTNKTIAIVSPSFQAHGLAPEQHVLQYKEGYIIFEDFAGPDTSLFKLNYKSRLSTAFDSTMYEILSKKGFLTKGPYERFDDITYSEKKQIYLTIIPKFNIALSKKITTSGCTFDICHESGVLQLGGSVDLKVIEPLTEQAILNARINLSDFHIEKKYTYDIPNLAADGYTRKYKYGYAIVEPEFLKNDFDAAMTSIINDFYKKAFEKIQKYISREELMDQEKDITGLKALKRF